MAFGLYSYYYPLSYYASYRGLFKLKETPPKPPIIGRRARLVNMLLRVLDVLGQELKFTPQGAGFPTRLFVGDAGYELVQKVLCARG